MLRKIRSRQKFLTAVGDAVADRGRTDNPPVERHRIGWKRHSLRIESQEKVIRGAKLAMHRKSANPRHYDGHTRMQTTDHSAVWETAKAELI